MTQRARVTYTGEQPIYLPGFIAPRPDRLERGTVCEVDAQHVKGLLARGDFQRTPDPEPDQQEAEGTVGEPVPVDVQREHVAEQLDAQGPADDLAGQALRDALADAGLSHAGTVAEQRARLAAWQHDRAANVGLTAPTQKDR